jgi:cytochrome c556
MLETRRTALPRTPNIALALALAAGCAAVAPAPVAQPAPESLPPWMRPLVLSQMTRQRDNLNELRWTAASLEFERTGALARAIAREVPCGRPADGSISRPEVIPASYRALEKELAERAHQLADAAGRTDVHAVSQAYGAVVATCARCHDLYRQGAPLALPRLSGRQEGARP